MVSVADTERMNRNLHPKNMFFDDEQSNDEGKDMGRRGWEKISPIASGCDQKGTSGVWNRISC